MKIVVLNHKSYLNYDEIINYKKEIENIKSQNTNIILMPNIAYISLFKNSNIKLGAQNFYSYNSGSYTGETSLEILKDLNVTHTLVGHPERLILGLDTYEQIKYKLFRSLNSGFKTILCIGINENIKQIKKELKYYFKGIEYNKFKELIIAFEPASKIEGDYINIEQIEYIKEFIKKYMKNKYDIDIPFIYGGSVNKENIREVLNITDGVIIGKIGTNIQELKDIIECINTEK